MAFDGIVIANLAKELNDMLTGGRIYKIAQPEKDELLSLIHIFKHLGTDLILFPFFQKFLQLRRKPHKSHCLLYTSRCV